MRITVLSNSNQIRFERKIFATEKLQPCFRQEAGLKSQLKDAATASLSVCCRLP
jgi:hypothetical protein